MIDLAEINNEIAKLEKEPTSYAIIERLSWLYTVKDHLSPAPAGKEIPGGDSDYMKVCCGKPIDCVMSVMDELMSALFVLQPRLYNAVMEKITLS